MLMPFLDFITIKNPIMKKLTIILLTFSYLIFTSSTCKKNGNCTETSYSFEAYAKVINPYDSITVGDTIWLEIIAPIAQVDRINGQTVTFSNAENLGTAIGFAEIILPEIKGAANDFDYVLIKGTTVSFFVFIIPHFELKDA